MNAKKKQAEQWLLADDSPPGVLAWDRPLGPRKGSLATSRAARALVTQGLPLASLGRVKRVAKALSELEYVESMGTESHAKKHGG